MTGEFSIAIHALSYLHLHGECVSSQQLAASVCTNSARIRKVLSKLKKVQLVKTREGFEGGYFFDGNPEFITLADIINALDEAVIPTPWKSGSKEKDCLVSSGMGFVMDTIQHTLNTSCVRELEKISLKDVLVLLKNR